jgi:hypothetical protein
MKEIDMQQEKDKSPKQAYEKPRLRVIELAAEEILAVGCKTSPGNFSGKLGQGCANPLCSVASGS